MIGWHFKNSWSCPQEGTRTADPLFLPPYYRSKCTPLVDHRKSTCASLIRLIRQLFILHSFSIWQQARCLLSCRPVVVLLKPVTSNLSACKSKIMAASCDRENEIVNAKSIVRAFSWKAYAEDPDNDLAKSLMIAEAGEAPEEKQEATLQDQWMRLFDPAVSKALKYG